MSDSWTILDVLKWTTERFQKAELESPRLDAEILLSHALCTSRVALYTGFDKPLSVPERDRFRDLVKRRLAGEPIAYIVGEREFWSLPLWVDPAVLIPRQDTETLVEVALRWARSRRLTQLADVATGSGAVALALATELPDVVVHATDLSEPALGVARRNAQRHGLSARVTFFQGDLLTPLSGPYDLIVSNPPYVPTGDLAGLSAEVRREPVAALDGGGDGLDLVRRLVAGSGAALMPGGALFLEHGHDQGPACAALLSAAGFQNVATTADLAGHGRITGGERRA